MHSTYLIFRRAGLKGKQSAKVVVLGFKAGHNFEADMNELTWNPILSF